MKSMSRLLNHSMPSKSILSEISMQGLTLTAIIVQRNKLKCKSLHDGRISKSLKHER